MKGGEGGVAKGRPGLAGTKGDEHGTLKSVRDGGTEDVGIEAGVQEGAGVKVNTMVRTRLRDQPRHSTGLIARWMEAAGRASLAALLDSRRVHAPNMALNVVMTRGMVMVNAGATPTEREPTRQMGRDAERMRLRGGGMCESCTRARQA